MSVIVSADKPAKANVTMVDVNGQCDCDSCPMPGAKLAKNLNAGDQIEENHFHDEVINTVFK